MAPAAKPTERQVLRSFSAPPYEYELSLENCMPSPRVDSLGGSVCAFALRLLEKGTVRDRVSFFQTGCGPASPASVTRTLGADRESVAWATNDEHCDVEIAARTVDLGPGAKALLVTELQGFEYRYRSHALYLSRKRKLDELWRHDEDSSGTQWTTTTVIPGAAGNQDVAFVDTLRNMQGVAAKITAQRLRFDPAAGTVAASPLPDAAAPLFVLQVGRFKSVAEARKARRDCLHDLDVVRASLFPGLRLPASFLGAVFAGRPEADAAVAALAHCPDASKTSVIELPFSGGAHGKHH